MKLKCRWEGWWWATKLSHLTYYSSLLSKSVRSLFIRFSNCKHCLETRLRLTVKGKQILGRCVETSFVMTCWSGSWKALKTFLPVFIAILLWKCFKGCLWRLILAWCIDNNLLRVNWVIINSLNWQRNVDAPASSHYTVLLNSFMTENVFFSVSAWCLMKCWLESFLQRVISFVHLSQKNGQKNIFAALCAATDTFFWLSWCLKTCAIKIRCFIPRGRNIMLSSDLLKSRSSSSPLIKIAIAQLRRLKHFQWRFFKRCSTNAKYMQITSHIMQFTHFGTGEALNKLECFRQTRDTRI